MANKKITEWHIIDHIKTDEDVHALLAAEREPYEKALRTALQTLNKVYFWLDEELLPDDIEAIDNMIDFICSKLRVINKGLEDEGIKIGDEKCEIATEE